MLELLVQLANEVRLFTFCNSTGVTGYIAGDALKALYQENPEFEYRLLIRTKEKADQVQKQFPSAILLLGDLDSSSLLEEEASKADIVLRKQQV